MIVAVIQPDESCVEILMFQTLDVSDFTLNLCFMLRMQKHLQTVPGTAYSELTVRLVEKETVGVLFCFSFCLRR